MHPSSGTSHDGHSQPRKNWRMPERIFSALEGCLNVDWNNCLNVLRNLAGMRLKEVARELELQDQRKSASTQCKGASTRLKHA